MKSPRFPLFIFLPFLFLKLIESSSSTFQKLFETKFPGIFHQEHLEENYIQEGTGFKISRFHRRSFYKFFLGLDNGRRFHENCLCDLVIPTLIFDYSTNPLSKEILDKYLITFRPSSELVSAIVVSCVRYDLEELFNEIINKYGFQFQDAEDQVCLEPSLLWGPLVEDSMRMAGKLKYIEMLYRRGFHVKFLNLFLIKILKLLNRHNYKEIIRLINYFAVETGRITINYPLKDHINQVHLYPIHLVLESHAPVSIKRVVLEAFKEMGADMEVSDEFGRSGTEIASYQGIFKFRLNTVHYVLFLVLVLMAKDQFN